MQKRRLYKIDSEDEIQANFFSWLGVHSVKYPILHLFYAVPSGGYRHLTTALRLKKTGTKPGIPDCHFPVGRNGFNSLYIEFKTAKGTLSDSQKIFIMMLREHNNNVQVCRSWTEAAELVIKYLDLPMKI